MRNATPTGLNNAPGRWPRGIARAIELVVCAIAAVLMLAGADLAQAQPITYRGAGTTGWAASGNPSAPGLPTGWQPDDIHIAIIEACNTSGSVPTVTMPAGWNLINTGSQGNHSFGSNDGCKGVLFWRRALAGDTAPAITNNSGDTIIAVIIGFYNVDLTTPLDTTTSFTDQANDSNPTTVKAGAITTVTADTMLVFIAMMPDKVSHTGSPGTPAGSSPWSSLLWRETNSSGTDCGIGVYYGLRSAVGVQPALTSTLTGGDGSQEGNSGAQLALRPRFGSVVPGRFNAYDTTTAAGAIVGFIKTRVAGTTINNVDIIAVNALKTAIDTAFTGAVTVQVLDASDNSGTLDADACRSSWTAPAKVIQTLSPNPNILANGRLTISFTVPNSYPNVRLRITSVATPSLIGCSTDNFANRPNTFINFSVTDGTWVTAGTARTLNNTTAPPQPGGLIHKAGQPFTVQALAVNGAGTPATTTNYTGAPTADLTDCGAITACPPPIVGGVALNANFVAGVLNSNAATYSDVGSFFMQLKDMTYSNVDATDGTAGDCTATGRYICSSTLTVGRFVPDNFLVQFNTPSFGTACSSGTFTYVGQKFNYVIPPVITVTARNASNGTTANYTGALWQITSASLSAKSYTWAAGTLDTSGITGTDPVISSGAGGVGTLTFGSGTGIFFTRTTPVAPFNADISLAINLGNDAEAIAIYASNPARFGTATAGNGIAFDAGKTMRFGRLTIRSASGSSLMPLQVRVEAQYWSSVNNAFITNTLDNCTSIATNNVAMSNFTNNLAACETANTAVTTLSAGRGALVLAAPGSANYGSVDLKVNLGAASSGTTCTSVGGGTVAAAGANRTDLQANWTGGAYTDNPSAQATFGTYSGTREVVYVRENY